MINLVERYEKDMVKYLSQKGQDIIDNAYRSKEAKDRSGNMHDAYGYAIFSRGQLVKKGYASGGVMSSKVHKGWAKHDIPADTGRGYLDSFFEEFKTRVSPKGFVLICVNAVYYASILEAGAQGRPHREISTKYRIISQIGNKVYDIRKFFPDAVISVVSPTNTF